VYPHSRHRILQCSSSVRPPQTSHGTGSGGFTGREGDHLEPEPVPDLQVFVARQGRTSPTMRERGGRVRLEDQVPLV